MDGWPEWQLELVSNRYNVVSLVHTFVDRERYDRSFKQTDVSILDGDDKYFESIIMFGVLGFIVGVILMAALLVFTCIKSCLCSGKKSDSPRRRSCTHIVASFFLLVFIVVGLLAHGIGFAGEKRFSKVMNDTCDTIDYAFKKIVNIETKIGKHLCDIFVQKCL